MSAGERLQLIEPAEAFRAEFESFCHEFGDRDKVHGAGSMFTSDDFSTAVRNCRDHARGVNVASHWVPATTFWLVRDDRTILGTASLRHRLNDYLQRLGGHIGYSIRPSERQKGYATRMLGALLIEARKLGLQRVLITCDKQNLASAKVVQKNGGVLQDEVASTMPGRDWTQRYWIEL